MAQQVKRQKRAKTAPSGRKKQGPRNTDPSKPLSPARWEAFAQDVFGGMTQADAYRTHYPRSRKWKAEVVHAQASLLARKVAIRVDWLKEQAASKRILSVEQRKAILSRIAHAVGTADPSKLSHAGADGVWYGFGDDTDEDTLAAIGGWKSRTDESGAVIQDVKLRPYSDATNAIAELNKMEGSHAAKELNVRVSHVDDILDEIDGDSE